MAIIVIRAGTGELGVGNYRMAQIFDGGKF